MAKIGSITVKCGHCGERQPYPFFIADVATFESMVTIDNVMECRKCRRDIHANKENTSYVLVDGSGGSVGPDLDNNKV